MSKIILIVLTLTASLTLYFAIIERIEYCKANPVTCQKDSHKFEDEDDTCIVTSNCALDLLVIDMIIDF